MKSLMGLGLVLAIVVYLPAQGLLIQVGKSHKEADGVLGTRKARATESFPQDQPQQTESGESEASDEKSEGITITQLPSALPVDTSRYRVFPVPYWMNLENGRSSTGLGVGKGGYGRQYDSSAALAAFMRRVGKADSNFIRFGRSFPYMIGAGGSKKNNFIRLGRENPRQTNFIRLGRSSLWKHSDRLLPTVGFFPDDLYYTSAGPHWANSLELPTSSELRRSQSN